MRKFHLSFVAALFLLTSCKSVVVQSESQAFLLRHPQLREEYVRLEPTSIYHLRHQLFSRSNQIKTQINLIREIAPTNSALIAHMEKVGDAIYEGDKYPVDVLSLEQEKWGGEIFLYELKNGKQGYVLIRDGEIKARAPLTQGMQ